MPIRPLSKELQELAIKELNEVPSKVQADIDHIREWISQQPHLKARTDDQFIVTFLRHAKFSLQRAKEKIDSYYSSRALAPESQFKDPFLPEIQEALNEGIVFPLPKTVDAAAPRILMVRMQKLKSEKITLETVLKLEHMLVDILTLEDDNFAVAGTTLIVDVKDFPISYFSQLTVNFSKKLIMFVQETYPIRVKDVNHFSAPSYVIAMHNMLKMFYSKKLRERVFFHSTDKVEVKTIPPSVLPKEYGGDEVSCDEIAASWKKKVESYRDWFLEDAQYGTDETKRVGKPKNYNDMFGVEGSFVKLEID